MAVVRARVSKAVKTAVAEYAKTLGDSTSGETEAVVVREALGEYFAARGIKIADQSVPATSTPHHHRRVLYVEEHKPKHARNAPRSSGKTAAGKRNPRKANKPAARGSS